jgi:alpha-maltose-1-phosphate synthase
MSVAIVYPIPFGREGRFGGGERYCWELAKAMATRVDTTYVTIGGQRTSELVGRLRVETYPWLTLLRGNRGNPLSFAYLRSLLNVDVIHCHSYQTTMTDFGVLLGRAAGKRVFITDHGGGGSLSLARWINVKALAHGLLVQSDFAGARFPGASPPRHVVYGGVDAARFRPGSEPRRRNVLYVGRLLPHKGVSYLIDAVRADVPLVLVGPRHSEPAADAYFRSLTARAQGKDVTFVTDATDDRVVAAYQTATVSVLPSVYRLADGDTTPVPELLGLVAVEAMACGTPVICTAVGSLPEVVIDGETGIVVPPNDSRALGAAIDRLLENPALAARMGRAGRERVLQLFTWDRVAARCLDAYASRSSS